MDVVGREDGRHSCVGAVGGCKTLLLPAVPHRGSRGATVSGLAHVRVLLKSPATMTAPAPAPVWQSFEKLATGGHVCDGGIAAKH